MATDVNVWIAFALFGIISSAALAAAGFRGRESVVGIDLGTTFSVAAVRLHDTGAVEVIPDADGHLTTPSVVSYLPDGRTLVGRAAAARLGSAPTSTIFNAKRFIGRSFSDPVVQQEAAASPFRVRSGPADESKRVGRRKEFKNWRSSVDEEPEPAFELPQGQLEAPEEVGRRVVEHLMGLADRFLGHNQISRAVIAVPAEFNQRQKKATARAFEAAGLTVVRILEEPTAAAIAYGLDREPSVHHVIVFDLGGGTLDVSLLYINRGAVEVLMTAGDNHLGGEDFDRVMLGILKARLGGGMDIPEDDSVQRDLESHSVSALKPCTSDSELKVLAEKAKRELSVKTDVTVRCASPDMSGSLHAQIAKVSRREFEAECAPLLERATEPVLRVLEEAHVSVNEVDAIVMVGGGSRMPMVREKVRSFFEDAVGGAAAKMNTRIDPDLAVAIGAASVVD
jgi:molecular chaperone DnaK (HSP70)